LILKKKLKAIYSIKFFFLKKKGRERMDDEYLNEFPISDGLDFFIQNPNRTIKDGLWLLFFPFGYGYIYTTIQIRLCASFTNYMNEPIWRKKKR
jgi:hypothetical protein